MKILEFQPHEEHVRQVWRWWSGVTLNAGRPPRRIEIDPGAFLQALHKVWLVEWVAELDSFRYRLAGEDINRTHGFSLKGKTVAEIFAPAARERVDTAWREVLGRPAVGYQLGKIYEDEQTVRQGERLVLPILADEGSTAGYLLGVTSHPRNPFDEDPRIAELLPNENHVFFSLKDLLAKKA